MTARNPKEPSGRGRQDETESAGRPPAGSAFVPGDPVFDAPRDESESERALDVERYDLRDHDYITVCAACRRAICWAGIEFCDRARTADLEHITVREARALDLEHPSYWVELRKAEGYR